MFTLNILHIIRINLSQFCQLKPLHAIPNIPEYLSLTHIYIHISMHIKRITYCITFPDDFLKIFSEFIMK